LKCKTKPIHRLQISGTAPGNRRPPSAELSDCGLKTGFRRARPARDLRPLASGPRGAGGTNKANSPLDQHEGDGPPRPLLPGQSCETKPISARAELELSLFRKKSYVISTHLSRRAKQSQFPAGGTGPGGRGAQGKYAKQTQFPATPAGAGSQGRGTRGKYAKRTQSPRRDRAVLPRLSTRRPRPRQADCAKESQLPTATPRGKHCAERELW
jgi:hypothetical protein